MPPAPPGAPGFGTTQHTGTNGMSIASLVLGILSIPMCFLFLPAILAIVFGLVGLGQIKNRPGQSGRGLAITGVVLGGIGLLVIVAVIMGLGNADFTFDTQTIIR